MRGREVSSSSTGTFSASEPMEALALTKAESIAWVWPATMPASTHRESTRAKTSSKSAVGKSWRVLRDGRVPGQGLVELVIQKIEQVQPQAAVLDKAPLRGNILQVRDQAKLKKDDWVDRLLAAAAIVRSRQLIEK